MATEAAWLNGNRLTERRKRKCALTSTGLLMEGVSCPEHWRRNRFYSLPRVDVRGQLSHYHTSHRSAGARTIAESFLQPNASAKAGIFDNGPITRYFAIG